MLSKNDHVRYFEQIACLERQKVYRLFDLLHDLADVYVVKFLSGMLADAQDLYGRILSILQLESLAEGGADKRLVNRRSALGKVRLLFSERGTTQEISACCVNYTHQGLCFESANRVAVGAQYEVLISLFDQKETMRCTGKIAWVKETFPGFFTAGMQFDT